MADRSTRQIAEYGRLRNMADRGINTGRSTKAGSSIKTDISIIIDRRDIIWLSDIRLAHRFLQNP